MSQFVGVLDGNLSLLSLVQIKNHVEYITESGYGEDSYDAIYALKTDTDLVPVTAKFVAGRVYDDEGYRFCTYEVTDADGNTYGEFNSRFSLSH